MHNVSPYDPPKSDLRDERLGTTSRKGHYVIHRPGTDWPPRCFKCNKETTECMEVTFTYVNRWILFSMLLTFLTTFILAIIFRKKFIEKLPLCNKHIERRKRFRQLLLCLVPIVGSTLLVGIFSESNTLVIDSAAALLLLLLFANYGRLAYIAKIKDGNIWIAGAGAKFRKSLSEFINP